MGEWGIDNYQPHWSNSATELSDRLRQISPADMEIRSIWSLWDEEEDEWFNDAPIVVCTQTQQLEFCAIRLDEFSFSLNSIDLTRPVYWCGDTDPDTIPFRWVEQRNPEFANLVGKIISEIEIIESGIDPGSQTALSIGTGELSGIALKFEDDYLAILNGLDCNTLARKSLN